MGPVLLCTGPKPFLVHIAEALLASMVEERYGADKRSVLLLDERMQRINIWEGGRI